MYNVMLYSVQNFHFSVFYLQSLLKIFALPPCFHPVCKWDASWEICRYDVSEYQVSSD